MLSEQQEGAITPNNEPKHDPDRPTIYQIRVGTQLGPDWADWFEGLVITCEENGDMLLTGPVVDQAALHGLLKKVRDLGMPLVSVNPVPFHPVEACEEST